MFNSYTQARVLKVDNCLSNMLMCRCEAWSILSLKFKIFICSSRICREIGAAFLVYINKNAYLCQRILSILGGISSSTKLLKELRGSRKRLPLFFARNLSFYVFFTKSILKRHKNPRLSSRQPGEYNLNLITKN